MEIFLFIASGILILIGFAGCIVPVLPGTPLSFIGILLLHFTQAVEFSTEQLLAYGGLTLAVEVADYLLPIWFTKKFGGSKWGVRGSTIGLLFGLFFGPVGIILGPVVGAFAGELLSGKSGTIATKSAIGSFIGFLFNVGFKLMVCGYFLYLYVSKIFF